MIIGGENMEVKILKCSGDLYWYKEFIGATFPVYDEESKIDKSYRISCSNGGGYWIDNEDCEAIHEHT